MARHRAKSRRRVAKPFSHGAKAKARKRSVAQQFAPDLDTKVAARKRKVAEGGALKGLPIKPKKKKKDKRRRSHP